MADGFFRKTAFGKLEPTDEAGKAIVASMDKGEIRKVKVTKPRNIVNHRRFFALLKLCYEMMPEKWHEAYPSMEHLRFVLTVEAGWCDFIPTKNGPVPMPKSISFAKMDEAEFRDFWDKVVKVIVTRFLPGVNQHELEMEVLEMVA